MKGVYVYCLSLLFFTSSSHAQILFGLEGGVNMSTVSIGSAPGPAPNPSMLIGYRAGVLADYRLNDRFGIQLGAFYSVLGYKSSYSESQTVASATSSSGYNMTVQENFIRVPINLVLNMPLGSGTFFVAGGPFIGYGLNGTVTTTSYTKVSGGGVPNYDTSFTRKSNISFKDDSGGSKAFDYGFCASIGYHLPLGLFIRAGYEVSLAGLTPVSGKQTSICYTVSLGFLFHGNSRKKHTFFTNSSKYLHAPYNRLAWPQ
jgi:hypothetical protein